MFAPVLTFSFGRGNPEPWVYVGHVSVMLNAFDVVSGRRGVRRPEDVEVWVDSGGYQLLNGSARHLGTREVLEAQLALRPDYMVMPDDPRSPDRSLARYWEYLRLLEERGARGVVVPVVHTNWSQSHLDRLAEALDLRVVAVGGVADSLSRPFRVTSAVSLLKFLSWLSSRLPEHARLHVMGVGGLSVLPALRALGVATYDTASWVHDARYGIVRVGARAYTVKARGRDRLPRLPEDFECKCPACRSDPDGLRATGLRGLRVRALHNAYNLLEFSSTLSQAPRDPATLASHLESRGLLTRHALRLLRAAEELLG